MQWEKRQDRRLLVFTTVGHLGWVCCPAPSGNRTTFSSGESPFTRFSGFGSIELRLQRRARDSPWPIQALHSPVRSDWLRGVRAVQSDSGRRDVASCICREGGPHPFLLAWNSQHSSLEVLAACGLGEDTARSHRCAPGRMLPPASEPCQTSTADFPEAKTVTINFSREPSSRWCFVTVA